MYYMYRCICYYLSRPLIAYSSFLERKSCKPSLFLWPHKVSYSMEHRREIMNINTVSLLVYARRFALWITWSSILVLEFYFSHRPQLHFRSGGIITDIATFYESPLEFYFSPVKLCIGFMSNPFMTLDFRGILNQN